MTALLMATVMAVSPQAPTPTHEVLPRESLSHIAQCELGDANRWTELLELNRDQITDPDLIVEGWQITLPEQGNGDCPPIAAVQVTAPSVSRQAPRRAVAPRRAQAHAGGNLSSVRRCESGGDYGAVSSSGKYRGAYQFDQQTWESVGGSGDPAAASPSEQDNRANALQQQRGASPWPNCG